MAKTSKIKAILSQAKWYEKTSTWYYDIEMENGDKGSKGVKDKDSLKVGQELNYDLEDNGRGGFRIKAVKNAFQKAYGKIADNKEYQVGVMVGASINCATTLLAHDIIKKEQFEDTVKWLCNISLKMKEHFKEI